MTKEPIKYPQEAAYSLYASEEMSPLEYSEPFLPILGKKYTNHALYFPVEYNASFLPILGQINPIQAPYYLLYPKPPSLFLYPLYVLHCPPISLSFISPTSTIR